MGIDSYLFIHSPINGHLVASSFLPFFNSMAMNILMHVQELLYNISSSILQNTYSQSVFQSCTNLHSICSI